MKYNEGSLIYNDDLEDHKSKEDDPLALMSGISAGFGLGRPWAELQAKEDFSAEFGHRQTEPPASPSSS